MILLELYHTCYQQKAISMENEQLVMQ